MHFHEGSLSFLAGGVKSLEGSVILPDEMWGLCNAVRQDLSMSLDQKDSCSRGSFANMPKPEYD